MPKDRDLLGVNYATANYQLHRMLLFALATAQQLTECFRCTLPIETIAEFSIEHKESWRRANDPKASFFDLSNIAFSHYSCNVGAVNKVKTQCPQGHPYDENNTYQNDGSRHCRRCMTAATTKFKQKRSRSRMAEADGSSP